MDIGSKIKSLRLKNGLTQEELGERTDLSKGFISQLERDMNSPSIETFFTLLEVLGTTPRDFFEDAETAKVIYSSKDHRIFKDDDAGFEVDWLIPTSYKKEMEPIYLTLSANGQYKKFEPSRAETFIYVLEGKVRLVLGDEEYIAVAGDSIYFEASQHHQLYNAGPEKCEMIITATHSYL
ncbi:helix-turn-helix domain-containing protein [Metaplanococcus flavidus]|uniref:Helix-turn-helix domain-containing protein n=1 Tax=Metaplanococcus flavidus TaxID=569883 RepID=A0ABW3L9X6_9BACL